MEGSITTLGVDGLDGMGGGGGAVYADNMNNNSSSPNPMYGGSGGSGIVVLRFPRDRFDTRVSSSGASDIIYVNDYVLVVFRSDSTISVRNDP